MINSARNNKGSFIIETAASLTFLVILSLSFLNVISLSLCVQANDALAKSACRAAARTLPPSHPYGGAVTGPGAPTGLPGNVNAPTTVQQVPSQVALAVVRDFQPNAIIKSAKLSYVCEKVPYYYQCTFPEGPLPPADTTGGDPPVGHIFVITSMQVSFPVPFPFLSETTIFSKADEPVTAVPYVADTHSGS